MKTLHARSGASAQPLVDSAGKTRSQRTAAKLTCEAMEGRQLMTGFAGAGPMMGHGFAEMGGLGGAGGDMQRHDRPDHFGGPNASSDQAQTDATSTEAGSSGTTSASPVASGPTGWTPTFAHDGRLDGDQFNAGPGDRMDGSLGRLGGERDVPMPGPGGSSDPGGSGQDATGSTQLKTDSEKLRTDEQAIHDKSQVTPALMAAVRQDLEAIDKAKTGDADATALKTLQTDEQTIFGNSPGSTTSATSTTPPAVPMAPPTLTDAQKATLQADHDAILKSQGVSQDLIDQLAKDQLAVKTASNFTDADQATLDADHQAIQTDLAALHGTDSTAPAANPAPATTSTTTAPASPVAAPDASTANPSTAATTATSQATPPAAAAPGATDSLAPATASDTSAPSVPPTAPVATAPQAPPTAPDAGSSTMARPRMNQHRGALGGHDAQFMHQFSTADHALGHSGGTAGQAGGHGVGQARRSFRR